MPYNETAVLELANNQHFFDVNLGPFLSGLAAQMFMMGCLTLQMWKYFEDHTSDSRSTKIFVVVLFSASTLQSITDFQLLYSAFVTGYGRILYWNKYGWTFIYEPAWTALIAGMTQGFFLHRCWTVTRSLALVATGGLGIVVSFGAGIASTAGLIKVPYYTETSQIIVQVTTWLIATAITDVGISIILVMHLKKMKTGFKQEKMLSRIVRVTFETAALTSVIAIIDLLLYITMGKNNTIHLAFQLVVGKTYNHSVMVTLLARTKIRSEFDSNSAGRLGNTDSGTKPNPGITVTRTQIRVADHLEYPMKNIATSARGDEDDLETDTNSAKIQRMV
ncbi:hypothetical protein DFH09DRAFT_1172533 [Mycena vulgaris]|nr:hypothetical protein DFH09DRAFT_1172533 [Mycena vulgaris]